MREMCLEIDMFRVKYIYKIPIIKLRRCDLLIIPEKDLDIAFIRSISKIYDRHKLQQITPDVPFYAIFRNAWSNHFHLLSRNNAHILYRKRWMKLLQSTSWRHAESQIKDERRTPSILGSKDVLLVSLFSIPPPPPTPHTGRTKQRRSRSHSRLRVKSTKPVTWLEAPGPAARFGTAILFADTPRARERTNCVRRERQQNVKYATRSSAFYHRSLIQRLLSDASAMVRAMWRYNLGK